MDRVTEAFNLGANGDPPLDTMRTSTVDRAYRLGQILRFRSKRVWQGRGHKINVQCISGVVTYDFAKDEDQPVACSR